MTEPTPDACRSCQRPLVWIRGARGRPIPCDPDPMTIFVPARPLKGAGPVVTLVTEQGHIVRGYDLGVENLGAEAMERQGQGALRTGRVSHFATCPDSHEWRGQRRSP